VRMKWYPEVMHHCPTAQVVLIGTKMDLRDDKDTVQDLEESGLKMITHENGEVLAGEIKALKYLECSALTMDGVKDVFNFAIKSKVSQSKSVGKGKKKKKDCIIF